MTTEEINRCEEFFPNVDFRLKKVYDILNHTRETLFCQNPSITVIRSDKNVLASFIPANMGVINQRNVVRHELIYTGFIYKNMQFTENLRCKLEKYIETGEITCCKKLLRMLEIEKLVANVLTGVENKIPREEIIANTVLKKIEVPRMKTETHYIYEICN